ncbi:MAG: primosomal protein N' [Candidatus Celaenobacter antarcticus]|nr:primosomal protein N' [Candidatus Celaenobacter antarcticus]
MKNYIEVALPINIKETFTYSYPKNVTPQIGQRVIVNFNYRIQTGIIVGLPEKPACDEAKIKEIHEIIDEKPLINKELFTFAQWISRYYHCPIGLVFKAMLPAGINVNTIEKIVLKKTETKDKDFLKIIKYIEKNGNSCTIEDLNHLKISPLYKNLLEMEERELVEIERQYKRKIQKKVVNCIRLISDSSDELLSPKQQELLHFLQNQPELIFMADISKEFSYSIINKLKEKNFIDIYKQEIHPDIFSDIVQHEPLTFELTEEQTEVLGKIEAGLDEQNFHAFLLHGVTSSGKTEVYIRAMKNALSHGKTAIILIPEISLTPQTVERFYSHFGDIIAVLHSKLSDRERLHYWNLLKKGEKKIAIGPRSALFAPLENLGLIIVDEEHENTYKQHERPPLYNARDMAVLRGKMNNAVVLLGTATPYIESYYNTQNKKYSLLTMSKRVKNQILPKLTVVDMRQEEDHTEIFSKLLRDKIEDRLNKKEQILLFQNRRGYASYVQCAKCGHVLQCKDCNISMTYHSRNKKMKCHYCGYERSMPRKCPECGGYIFNFGSPGTEKIEQNLQFLFPTARIVRMDTDTTTKKNSFQNVFDQVRNGYIDILLGTQMIIKGLDFPNITLVGIVSADVNLNLPDFRASERNFQHIIQVAGRAGRSEKEGEVIVQTFNPKHYSIQYAQKQNFLGFYEHELHLRQELHYPPFTKLARILFLLNNEERLRSYMDGIRHKIAQYPQKNKLIILSPTPAPISKIRKQYRYHILIKAEHQPNINRFIEWFHSNIKIPNYIKMQIDIDPISLL